MSMQTKFPRHEPRQEEGETSLQQIMNELFADKFPMLDLPAVAGMQLTDRWLPPLEVFEDEDRFEVSVELPGVRDKDVEVVLLGDMLTIQGRKLARREPGTRHRSERCRGAFKRRVQLSCDVDQARLTASLAHGVLEVTLPKAKSSRVGPCRIGVTSAPDRPA